MPLISCSSDDEGNWDDPITARWQLTAEKEIIDEEEVDLNISDCRKESRLQLYGDGQAVIVEYSDSGDGSCAFDGSSHEKWEKRGDNIYVFVYKNGNERVGEFTFNENTLTIHFNGENIIYVYTMTEDY
ncbi:lipocalin family protein [Zhouia spongiae]|uniref:Lipocalin family protein n=1 Tax=Zhouia spongiae TaxID=2202721 RepID=A0ABY3YN08_9FLAO|nr:lipocalin family protein [Zhouia spongiae]UNY99056.1 lipocalin family protein [Zhouia spongiae]